MGDILVGLTVICSSALTGFANFIDEWSQRDFCFTNFGVKHHNEKSNFQTFQHVVLACIHYHEGYTK